MAYQTGTTTDIDDLMSKLGTFVVANGWTQETTDQSANHVCFSRSNCYVSFRWDITSEHTLAIYQSLGFILDSTLPHNQTDDSGNGSTTSPATTERRVNFTDGSGSVNTGPYTAYHFFEDDTVVPYVYVVVEMSSGVFRHFGFGTLEKSNDWVGGEFVYGHVWHQATSQIDIPTGNLHHFLLDGIAVGSTDGATMHVEDLPGMGVDDKWGVFLSSSSPGTDTAGEDRVALLGGSRSGLYGYHLAWMPASQLAAHKVMWPIVAIYRDISTSPDTWYWLGEMPNITGMNMANYAPGDIITIGGQDWVVFPWVRNQYLSADTEETRNAGVAYKKVT